MREQGSGAIVNVSSISGKVGNFGQTNYSAAKAGIVGLTKAAAKELARKNVRVNAVAPSIAMHPHLAKRCRGPRGIRSWPRFRSVGPANRTRSLTSSRFWPATWRATSPAS